MRALLATLVTLAFFVGGLIPGVPAVAAATTINMDGQSLSFRLADATRIKDGPTPTSTVTVSVTSSSYSSGTVTYNGSANSLTAGQQVTITGSNVATYNGTYTVATKSNTKFTVTRTISPSPSNGGSATATQTTTSAITAESDGNVYLYSNVGPGGATPIDATVETVLTSATIASGQYDPNSNSYISASSLPDTFMTQIGTTAANGGLTLRFHFYVHGTVTNTAGVISGTDVVLQNIKMTSIDLDNGNQFTEFSGFQQYSLSSSPSSLITRSNITSTTPYRTRFLTGSSSNNTDADTDAVTVLYSAITAVSVKFGTTAAASTSAFAVFFGPRSWAATPTTTDNGYNVAPTSASTALTVASGSATVLSKADLGFTDFSDADGNSYAGIQIPASPSFTGTLEYRNSSGTWIAAPTATLISVADIEAGKVRFTGTAGTSIPFKVYDGLAYSSSSYSLVISVSGKTPQSISATNPGTKAPGLTFSLTASATSSGTLTTTAGPSGVCTISGLSVTTVAAGTCTVTFDQAGGVISGTDYLPATQATLSFTVSEKTAQTITFSRPSDVRLTAGTTTVAPTASSNLTVTVTSSDTSACTVSGFTITLKKIGTCYLDADQAGDGTYAPAPQVSQYFYITNPLPAPSAPTTGTATSSSLVVNLTSPNANASSHTLYVYSGDGATLLRTISNFTSGSAVTGLSAGTDYKFSALAVGDGITWSDSAEGSKSLVGSTSAGVSTLTYDANGGSNAPASVTQVGPFTAAEAGSLAWAGHTFVKWNTLAGGNGTDYAVGDSVPVTVTTLYAQWALNMHTVSFSTGAGCSTVASFDLAFSSNLQAQVSSRSTPSCIGYSFSKWQIGGVDITSGQTMPDNDVTVTAVWTTNTHTVSFSNGTNATTTASVTGVAYGSDLDAVINAKSHPTRTGYTFGAWQISGVDITNSETMPDADVTVTVRWITNTHTVSFSNGANATTTPSVTGVEYNSDLEALVSSQTQPTRTGYTFSKWQISGVDITSGQAMPDTDVTVVAVWTINRHAVNFENGAGATTTASVSNVAYAADLDAVITAKSRPTRTGYTFGAWQISGVDITNSETMPDADVTVTVRWTINTYTVSFSNGANATTTPSVTGVEYNSDLEALVSSQTQPTRTGYTFSKWQISGVDITSGQTMPASNVTVTAVWTLNSHTLSFDTGADASTVSALTVDYGVNLRTTLNTVTSPTRTGYTFSKWQIGGADVTVSQTMPDTDLTATAVWVVNTHTVSFDTGANASVISSRSLAYGGNLEALVNAISAPSRPGYTFSKWQISGADITSGQTMPDEDVTVTAMWLVTYVLTYHANGGSNAPAAASSTTDFIAAAPALMRWADHAFVTWNTQADGNGTPYLDGDTVPNTVTDLYAVWVLSGNEAQAITYVQPTTQAKADGSLTVAPVTDADGLDVDLTSETSSVCTVAGYTITFVSAGLCTTTASQPGDSTYRAADPVTRSFRIIEITTEQLEGGRVNNTYTSAQSLAGAAGGGVWSTASALPAGLSVNQLTGALEGTPTEPFNANVTFSYTEDGATVTKTLLLQVVDQTYGASQAITFAQPSTKSLVSHRFTVSPVSDAPSLIVILTSQTTSVCTVSGFDVTFHTTGLCTLSANQPGNVNYQAATPVVRSFRIIKLTTSSLPTGKTGEPYRATQTLAGAIGNGHYSTVSTLPAGLTLTRSTGVLAGIPTEAFDRTVTITYVEDGAASSVRLRLTIFPGQVAAPVTESGATPTPSPSPSPSPTPAGPSNNTVDVGRGVTTVAEIPKLSSIGQADIEHLQAIGGEAMEGFKPGSGVRVDIVGAKTLNVFSVTPGTPIDVSGLAKALPNSGDGREFITASSIVAGSAPTHKELDALAVADGDAFFFKSAGLGNPSTLAHADLSQASQWVKVSVSLTGLRPGSNAYLVTTSSPIVFGQAVVNQFGVATVSGSMPLDILTAGVHRIRVVGNRDLGTVETSDTGAITLTGAQLAQIREFDEGTFATVRVEGTNSTGGQSLSIRLVPIDKNVPWWLLWVFGAVVLLSFLLRWRRVGENTAGRVLKRLTIGVIGVGLAIAGLIIDVPLFWVLALVIAAIGLVGSWIPSRRARRAA